MSIKVQSYVWEHSRATGSALLLLLAIADHSHDDGTGAWPSTDTLAKKCRQSVRNVSYLLRKLEELGDLQTQVGKGPNGCNAYIIPMTPANFAPLQTSAEGMQTSVDDPCKPARQIAPEPLGTIIKPSLEPSRESAQTALPSEPSLAIKKPRERKAKAKPADEQASPDKEGLARQNYYPVAAALSEVCGMPLSKNRGHLFREAQLLCAGNDPPPVTPELIREQYGPGGWWWREDWRGKKGECPTPAAIRAAWGQWTKPKVIPIKPSEQTKAQRIDDAFEAYNRRKQHGAAADDPDDSKDVFECLSFAVT